MRSGCATPVCELFLEFCTHALQESKGYLPPILLVCHHQKGCTSTKLNQEGLDIILKSQRLGPVQVATAACCTASVRWHSQELLQLLRASGRL